MKLALRSRLRRIILRLMSSPGGLWAVGATALWMSFKIAVAVGLFLGLSAAIGFFASAVVALAVLLFFFRPRWRQGQLERALRGLRHRSKKEASDGDSFVSWKTWPVDPAVRHAVEEARQRETASESLTLGEIGDDGRLKSPFGSFPGFQKTAEEEFLSQQVGLELVLLGDRVLVRKDYRGQVEEMAHETFALFRLATTANVPSLHSVDLESTIVHLSFTTGDTVNDLLVEAGARIQPSHTEGDPELEDLSEEKCREAILARGRAFVPQCLSEDFLHSLERQIEAIHGCQVAGLNLSFGDLVIDVKRDQPCFIDFAGARTYHESRWNLSFALRRMEDRDKLERFYQRGTGRGVGR